MPVEARLRWVAAVAGSAALHASAIGILGAGSVHPGSGAGPLHAVALQVRLAAPQAVLPVPAPAPEPIPELDAVAAVPAAAPGRAAPETGGGILPAPVYLPTSVLTRSPRPLAEPDFGDETEGLARSGGVVLELLVSRTGTIDAIEVVESDLPESDRRRARQAFAALRFAPGELRGTRVPARMRVEVSVEAGRGAP
ncbi:MAG TPA: hypothetical protein DHV08_12945 [Rhodocyclaceae bacterium]|nr:hypothetical protein [Rhodocyclaceae bacterium]